MAYFNLPFSVRIADDSPIDGDRYLAPTLTQRDALVTIGRAKAGQQVYVESNSKLYLLTGATNADWVEVSSSGDLNYVHTQPSAASQWNVSHNLGKRPSVVITNSSEQVVDAEVTYIDDNTVQIAFNTPFIGIAIFN